ncbi:hypothetical protein CPLU01_06427 [Colletotrichum plurivorum]|uniref:Uncharacterized protein n=1 Tax=Colletotrichum plurivorum TaxID=2175906 RepID=A0A8H6KIP2_9PEZI|nr:hypothetical protein CPLU01_06427 [Colletotrichum plurivorum]
MLRSNRLVGAAGAVDEDATEGSTDWPAHPSTTSPPLHARDTTHTTPKHTDIRGGVEGNATHVPIPPPQSPPAVAGAAAPAYGVRRVKTGRSWCEALEFANGLLMMQRSSSEETWHQRCFSRGTRDAHARVHMDAYITACRAPVPPRPDGA